LAQLLHENFHRYEESEILYRKSLELDPKNSWAWGHLGILLHTKLANYEEAEKAYVKAQEIELGFAYGWYLLGILRSEKLNKPEEAEYSFRKAIELKSLKYYFTSFRSVGIYQEAVTKRIFSDLKKVLKTNRIHVETIYATRGGFDVACEEGKKIA
jgi:tetratricopeptide (TPR) repeat protein